MVIVCFSICLEFDIFSYITKELLAPGENPPFEPGENSQFQPGRNRQGAGQYFFLSMRKKVYLPLTTAVQIHVQRDIRKNILYLG